jgi:hypothetical protein
MFLQFVVVLIGGVMLVLMLWEPHLEGRNENATVFQVYFNDPFLAYAYTASLPGFWLLYQAYQALGLVGEGRAFSPATVQAVRTIKYCALAVIGFLAGGEAWLFLYQSRTEDIAGGVAIGLFFIIVFAVIAMAAAVLERFLQNRLPQNAVAGQAS